MAVMIYPSQLNDVVAVQLVNENYYLGFLLFV